MIQEGETLDILNINNVFERCLETFDVLPVDRTELTSSYNEIIKDLQEEDKMPNENDKHELESSKSQFLVYQTDDGTLNLDVRFEDESVWPAQQLMADLFQTSKQNISLHIQNIYKEEELPTEATVKNDLTVRSEGTREVKRCWTTTILI